MLPKGPYQPQLTEEEILAFWLENNFYSPEYQSDKELSTASQPDRETFCIVLPPPNANGNLHLGHMSGYAYQDLMGRYNRMKGKKVLLLPGKDHAGIQTEVVFEKILQKEGLSKRELGREEFYKRCYEFCIKNSENAREQEKKIGLSADFDRELFTLDPKIVTEVLKAFELMYRDKLVYRDKRIINWCPRCQSALADIDTEFKDSITPFYYFKYAFVEPDLKAINLKNEFSGKSITWKYERSSTSDEKTELPFSFGKHNDIEIVGIGYDNPTKEINLQGKVIGIQMRLDRKYRLVVQSETYTENIDNEIDKIFLFEIKYYAGSHIILFDKYPDDKYYTNGFIIGTVRPETKFGDTALAVDPDDSRYTDFVGNTYEVKTLMGTSKIKVISDQSVEEEFGTGLVKVTPAHAVEDWEIANRHPEDALPEIQVIDFNGKMNHMTGKYNGMTIKEARKAMIEDLKVEGMLIYLDENYKNRIRICERCKYPIEPLISYQWFVDTEPLKQQAKRLVKEGFTEIMPDGKKKTYMQWMDSKEDWCITRQLWWGYRLPVWYRGKKEQFVTETGEVREKIGGKEINKVEDYEDILYVGQDDPNKSKNMTITVLRHGETDYNNQGKFHGITDIELNESGTSQAQDAKVKLTSKFDVIICSPLNRARQTADIVNEELGLEIIENDLLKERNFGNLEGLTWEEFVANFPNEASKNNPDFQENLENGETIHEVENRIQQFIDWLKTTDYNNVLIVTHAGIIRIFERLLNNKTKGESRNNDPENLELREYILNLQEWFQDDDVLDTWFSSGQWPYLTLQAKPGDFTDFYPTQVMETGWDILLFWVTRMMLLNPYRAKNLFTEGNDSEIVPFKNVYLHGLVLDKNGVKMSKSKGNGIDPFEMMEKYGTDALRFSFIKGNSVGQNYRLYEEKISSNRNFCNKIWNASKFVLFNIEDNAEKLINTDKSELEFTQDDTEMLKHLDQLIEETSRRLDEFKFGIAADELYESFWHYFADIYLEKIKNRLYTKDREGNLINTSDQEVKSRFSAQWLILHSLETYLKLLHPFIPFLTEKIWQSLPKVESESGTIMYSSWPNIS